MGCDYYQQIYIRFIYIDLANISQYSDLTNILQCTDFLNNELKGYFDCDPDEDYSLELEKHMRQIEKSEKVLYENETGWLITSKSSIEEYEKMLEQLPAKSKIIKILRINKCRERY